VAQDPRSPEPDASGARPAPGRKLRVTDPAIARQIEALGGRRLADYGSYQLFEMDRSVAPRILGRSGVEARDEYDRVLLNSGAIDTASPEARARPAPAGPFSGRRLHLVQFVGPVRPAWYAELEDAGLRIVDYVPHNAYIVYGDDVAIERLQDLARSSGHVQWEGPFRDEYRLHPSLTAGSRGQGDAPGRAVEPENELYAIQLVDDPPATSATMRVLDGLRVGPIQSRFAIRDHVNVIARLPAGALATLAARPDVISVQPYVVPVKRGERQDQVVAGSVSGGGPSAPGYLAFLADKGFGLGASDFVVDVTDSGVDDGTTAPNHFGLYQAGDIAGQSRVAYNRLEGFPHAGSTLQGCDGHGTINAHIVAGFSDGAGFPYEDGEGFDFGLGVAPFVKVGSSVIFDPDTYTFPSFPDLQSRAYRDGARISTNSWGAIVDGLYTVDSQAYDALVRDAQPSGSAVPAAGNQQMVIVFAAGNEGPFSQSLLAPGTAKNVITVGATEGSQPFGAPDQCGVSDADADSAEDIAYFSSRGPTSDGRRKPDLVAPGTHVSGGVFQQNPVPGGSGQLGQAGACFSGTAVCGGTAGPFFPGGQQLYTASSGTSHSTPAVAGGAALVRQFFVNEGLGTPSPAMTKAFLMSSARYISGSGAGGSLWSNAQGMGMMDLGTAFDGAPRVLRDQVPGDIFTASGQTRQVVGTIDDTTRPFRVTLTWTDAPGSTAGDAFRNDLDLTVQVAGATYRGNVFSGPYSVPGGAADLRDNVESVFLPAGQSGTFTVTVSAANINSDGVPNSGGSLDQDFALVVYNGEETPVPVIVAAGGALVGEGCGGGNGAVDPGETVTVDLALSNTGTADTGSLVATLLPTGGVTAPSAAQDYGSVAAGGPPVIRSFAYTAAGACGGTVTATLQLQDGGTDLGTASFVFPLGTVVPGGPVETRDHSSPIAIPTKGPGTPYPSTIDVSGLLGPVLKVTATLHGVSHAFSDDVDVLLVGPQGQRVLLMSDAGGGGVMNDVTLTFDDEAAAALPDGTTIASGTYRPSNYEGVATDNFPAPAPSGPFETALAAFAGSSPNGTWSLYVQDDFTGLGGSIAGGWSLSLTMGTPVCCTGPGIAVSPTSGLVTTESGDTATFTVALGTAPTADVTIALESSDPGEGTVSPTSLTFTPADATTPQTVTVTGVDDTAADGDVAYTVVTAAAVSADGVYDGLDAPDVAVTNADDDAAAVLVGPTSGLVTTESGGSASFTVVLGSVPTADVTVGLSSSNPGEGTVSPSSLTFTPADALVPRTVTVTGVDDALVDGGVAYLIVTAPVVSGDAAYDGFDPPDVAVTNADDEPSGILVVPTSGLVTTEAGGIATFTVALASTPTADVTIGLGSSDPGEGTVSPTSLTFTPANALAPQSVTVSGVDDTVADGSVAYTVLTAPAVSANGAYNGLDGPDVAVTNTDDDAAGITVEPTSGLVTTEAGGKATFTVVLASTPTADVTIALGSSNPAEGTVSPASLTFTTANALAPRTVTVTGVDDGVADGEVAYTVVTAPAVSADGVYDGLDGPDVSVTNVAGQPVAWTAKVGVSDSGSNLTKTAVTGWNAGAASANTLAMGDGSVAFTASETNTYRMLGLSNGNDSASYTDIDFAVYLAAGQVQVFEKGIGRGSFGGHAAGDTFEVAVKSGLVTYSRNGTVFYTSTATPTYPLLVDSALYSQGATLTNVAVYGGWTLPPPPPPPPPAEDVVWKDLVGVSASGNSLTKTAATGWNAGAASTKTLGSSPGFVAFTASETSTYRMLGLSNGNDNATYADIDYALYLAAGQVQIFEKGVGRGAFGAYAPGDAFQVSVEGNVVTYSRNGTVFYSSNTSPTYPLLVDAALYSQGATLTDVVISGAWESPPPPPPPPSGEAVVWKDLVGVSASGNSLTKTAATGWNAGAASTKTLAAGPGYVAFTASETSTYRMLGLSNGNDNATYADIDYALYLAAGQVQVLEKGVGRGAFGSYVPGDSFQVSVQGNQVTYSRNGTVFYTSNATPSYPLLVDSALYSQGATLMDVVISGAWESPPPPPPPPSGEAVVWKDIVGASASGNSLTKTAATGWNAGAASTRALAAGPGYVAFTASETSTYRMLGLSNGNDNVAYADIDYAIYLAAGQVQVLEKGAGRGIFGSYAPGDSFQVSVQGNQVTYSRNGTVFYTSGVTPAYPLLVDTALYSHGATLTSVLLSGTLQ
jgi:hypothetical protein